jgi:oligosaccharide amylase
MTRPVILGNGNMLVCLDKHARIRDLYYPHIGQENHVSSRTHRIGVWVGGEFSWISEEEWELSLKYKKDTLSSDITAYSKKLKVRISMNEAVHHDKNIYLRKICIENRGQIQRDIKVFFGQEFQISETNIGDTAYFDPLLQSIVHYKGRRYFLIGGQMDGKPFKDYATGVSGTEDHVGTYVDAEDGFLSKNAIEHGSVDSVIGFTMNLKKDESKRIDYWIIAGKNHGEVAELKKFVLKKTSEKLIEETEDFWKEWLGKSPIKFYNLNEKMKDLFKRSLLIIHAQTDKNGAIIASNDTHTFKFKKDTYSYMWPRDGALVARSFDKAGYFEITKKFFDFCSEVLEKEGYLLPKYRPDGSVGSSWHSWLSYGKVQLPIQEDETALVLDSLWKHYTRYKSGKMKEAYEVFIKDAGDFLANFRDEKMKLPKESYDLWEEKLGVHTFTCATVYAGLEAAKNFARIFGNELDEEKYSKAMEEIKNGILEYLYDPEEGLFIKRIYYDENGEMVKDKTVDMSTVYGLFEYKVLDPTDEKIIKTMEKTVKKLWCITPCGGISRYENDNYYRVSRDAPPNPWFISTFWLAEYYIAKAKKTEDLKPAEDLLNWATQRALPSGILSEQLNPYTGEHLSVSPLTWSHAGFIIAVIKYVDKYEKLTRQSG